MFRFIPIGVIFVASMLPGAVVAKPLSGGAKKLTKNQSKQFYHIASQNPKKRIKAKVSFVNDVTLFQVKNMLHAEKVRVRAFYHGTTSYTGGYRLQENERLEEAIVRYQKDHVFFINKRIEVEEKMLKTAAGDKSFQDAVIKHIREALQMKIDFEQNGIRVIAVELEGFAIDIARFLENNILVQKAVFVSK